MAKDLSDIAAQIPVECIEDEVLHQIIRDNQVQVVLVGSDCIMDHQVVNKIGTKALAETCQASSECSIICCGDRWKLWNDEFAPPLEDIFECIPRNLMDQVIVPEERVE